MNSILIITGGEVEVTSSLKYIKQKEYSKIIAVDGGLKACKNLGILPDIIIGDFDTVEPQLLEEYIHKGSDILKLNPIKDDTDTEAAFEKAVEFKPDTVDILGAIGSRFDHSYSNVFILKRGKKAGVEVSLITEKCRIRLIEGDTILKKNELFGDYVSLIQFDGAANGVTLSGFVYNVKNFDFDTEKTFRLGVSNEIKDDEAYIHIEQGYMLLMEAKD